MKTRIALFALTVGLFVTGCAGTQVAVNRFGGVQPSIYTFQPQRTPSVIGSEVRPLIIPNQFGSSFGSNDSQLRFTPFTYRLPYNFGGSLNLFNGTQLMQKPLEVDFPFNPDASLTLFRFNNTPFKFMPMMDGRF